VSPLHAFTFKTELPADNRVYAAYYAITNSHHAHTKIYAESTTPVLRLSTDALSASGVLVTHKILTVEHSQEWRSENQILWVRAKECSRLNLLRKDARFLRTIHGYGPRSCLLRPASHNFIQGENQTILYRGTGGDPLVAVVPHHRIHAWKWEALYEWPLEIELSSFYYRSM
jgi:hypothetical protein